jgi:hypothetical protein
VWMQASLYAELGCVPRGTAADVIYGCRNRLQFTRSGQTGALSGTATSLVIPAGTLAPNSEYDVTIGFTGDSSPNAPGN